MNDPTTGAAAGLTRREVGIILAVAVAARVVAAVVFDMRGLAQPHGEPWVIARNLHAGRGFAFDWYGLVPGGAVGSFLPPLYPWLLSVCLDIAGGVGRTALYLAQGLNVFLGAATCLLVAQLTALSGVASRRPLLAGLAWALYPPALGHAAKAHTPVLEGFLLILLAWFLLRALQRERRRWPIAGGVVLGLLLLVRPSHGLVWAAWSLLILVRARWRRPAIRMVLVTGVVAAAVLAPWTVRNLQVHGRLVPVATNGGFNFYLGNNVQMAGDIPVLDDFFASFPAEGPAYWRGLSEVERDRELYRQGLAYWREHPGRALRGAGNRLMSYAFFRPYLFAAYPRWLAALFVVSYVVVLVPFLLALPRRRGPAAGFSVLAVVVTGAVGLAYVVSMRFRASVEPLMVVVAAGCCGGQENPPMSYFRRRTP